MTSSLQLCPSLPVTPESVGWRYLSFDLITVETGQQHSETRAGQETAITPLSGSAVLELGAGGSHRVQRSSVFAELAPLGYVTPGETFTVSVPDDADGSFRCAIGSAPAEGRYPSRLVERSEIRSEVRGGGASRRQVNHGLAYPIEAERLILFEVFVPRGTWSGWAPHRHDGVDGSPYLEEVYFFRLDRPEGFWLHRNWHDDNPDRPWEELYRGGDGDLAIVPGGYQPADEAVRRFKADMVDAVARLERRPSAVMLEPEFSLPELAERVSEGIGITCALEAQGYFSDPGAGNSLMDGWHPARVRDVGAQVAKLLVLYRHDRGAFTEAQEDLVAQVVDEAAQAEVPALVEPVPIDLAEGADYDADRKEVIVTSARRLSPMGPMLLKMPYPGRGACAELTDACSDRPWILLSWGVPFDEFVEQLRDACVNGCSGFAVGRALWREAVDPATRTDFLATTFAPRLNQLLDIAATGRPWTSVLKPSPPGGIPL